MSSHLPKDRLYDRNECSPEDSTECKTAADADEGDSINVSQYKEEHGDKYIPTFPTVPCDCSESDKYEGVFDLSNDLDDVNDSSTISDDEFESGDVIESDSSSFSDEELIGEMNDSFNKTSNEVDQVCKSYSGNERKIYRYQCVQKRKGIRKTHTSFRQMHQEMKELRGYVKDSNRMYKNIFKTVKAYIENIRHENKESLESTYSAQKPFCNEFVIGKVTSNPEVLQCPFMNAFKNNLWIPRNDVFRCFERIQFVLFQFELKDEIIKRPSLNISCTLPYRRCVTLNTPTTNDNMKLQCLTKRERKCTLMVKKQPFSTVQALLSQAVQIVLTHGGTAMVKTNGGIKLYTESQWQLLGCQSVFVKFPTEAKLQRWCGFSKLSMSNRNECVSIPDGMMTGHQQSGDVQSLPTDLRTSDTFLATLLQMLELEKTDQRVVCIHIKGNEIRMRIVSPVEWFDALYFIQNCSRNKLKKQTAIHTNSVSTSIVAVLNTFLKSKYPHITICNNDRGDDCSSSVVLSSKDVEPERLMRSLTHPKRNICIGIQFLQFKALCQVRKYGSPPFPPENVRHIIANTLSPNTELAGKGQNTITDVSSLQLQRKTIPITHVTNKMTSLKPTDYRTCSTTDKSYKEEEKHSDKPAFPKVIPGSDQTSDSCIIRCGARPKRIGKNISKEKGICLETSSNHAVCYKHLQISNTVPQLDRMANFSSEFTRQNKRYKGFHQSNESSRRHQCELGHRIHITSSGKLLASPTTDHDNYKTESPISKERFKHNCEADFQFGSSRRENHVRNALIYSNTRTARDYRADNAILLGGHNHRYAQNLPTQNAGIIDNPIRNCSSVFENDLRDGYGVDENGNVNRVIPVTTEERPVQFCSRAVHLRSEAPPIIARHPRDHETWAICTSKSTRKQTPDDNRINYPLGVALPAAGVASGQILLTNTCAIDGFLLMVFIVLHFDQYLRDKFRRSANEFHKICFKIWTHFQKLEFDAGKKAWCLYTNVINLNTRKEDLTGTENTMIIAGFNQNTISVEEKCSNADCASHATTTRELYDVLTVHLVDGESLADTIKKKIGKFICRPIGCCKTKLGNGDRCNGTRIRNVVTFPDILAINLYFLKNENLQKPYSSCDIPDTIETNGETYDLKLIRFYKNGHFTEKLRVLDDWTYYDNTDARLCYFDRDPDFSQLSSCYYLLRCRH